MNLGVIVKKLTFSGLDHWGFTLVELLVAMAVGSIVIVGASQVLQQMFFLVPKAESSMLAMRQVEFAGHWIDRDTTMAQAITPSDNLSHSLSTTPLVISYSNWDATKTTVTYSVDANKILQRRIVVVSENTSSVISDSQMQIANSIYSIQAQYTQPAGMDRKALRVTIVATVGSASENRTFQTSPRSF
jgi:prepilin-type N-terminal cleavage/methylation domain-containing protein